MKNEITAKDISQGDVYKLMSQVTPVKTSWRTTFQPALAFGASGFLALALVWVVASAGSGLDTTSPPSGINQLGTLKSTARLADNNPGPLQVFETGPKEQLNEDIDADKSTAKPFEISVKEDYWY